jgi:hypothetical protein
MDPEHAVAANRELKQIAILGAAAPPQVPASVDELERLDVADERHHLQPAAVRVRRQRAADRQPIGPRLLLSDAPLPRPSVLALDKCGNQRRPLHAGINLDRAALGIERADLVERAQIDQQRVGRAAGCPSRAGCRMARPPRPPKTAARDGGVDLVRSARRQDALDASRSAGNGDR